MANALDLFRAQHEAAQEIHARLQEIETTLSRVRGDVDRLVHDKGFLAVLQQEQNWLAAAQRTVIEVRAWREQERLRYGRAWHGDGWWRWRLPSHRRQRPARPTDGPRHRTLPNWRRSDRMRSLPRSSSIAS